MRGTCVNATEVLAREKARPRRMWSSEKHRLSGSAAHSGRCVLPCESAPSRTASYAAASRARHHTNE
eukprot:13999385-Alexandrium_andersonii.AAC.1